jgi:hypothetical protein
MLFSDWSSEEPANCPHNSTETNICSSLVSMNATCVSIKCCHEFEDDDEYDYYDDSMAESEEENVYYFGRVSGCRYDCLPFQFNTTVIKIPTYFSYVNDQANNNCHFSVFLMIS